MFYNEEENEDYLTDKEIQEQGLDKVIENIYLRNGASEEYAQVTAPPREKKERKRHLNAASEFQGCCARPKSMSDEGCSGKFWTSWAAACAW